MKATVASRIRERLKGFADTLREGKEIEDLYTCRKIVLNLRPNAYSPKLVKEARTELGVSQAIFARFLGVSIQTVRAWEQGQKKPRGIACRFMDEIRCDPPYWRAKLANVAVTKTDNVAPQRSTGHKRLKPIAK